MNLERPFFLIPIYKNMPEQDSYNDKHYTEKMMHQQQQINSGLFNQF